MTAAPALSVDSPRWRVGRVAAYAVVCVCAVLFGGGLTGWALNPKAQETAVLWSLPQVWTAESLRQVLDALGSPLLLVAAYLMLLDLLWAVAGVVAALLVLRGARSWFRLYLGAVLGLWGTTGGALAAIYQAALGGGVSALVEILLGIGWCGAIALAYLFPDGRFVPRWTRWCVLALAFYLPVLAVLEATGVADALSSLPAVLPLLVFFSTGAYAAVHRYRGAGTVQRGQVRGVMAALVLWLAVVLLRLPFARVLEATSVSGFVAQLVYLALSYGAVIMLCVSVAVAVLRHRLYRTDAWVNAALVYGALTGVLALLYALVAAIGALVWHGNGLAAPLVATIVIAVVLHPLRLRVQVLVDRFVYGHSLDPRALLADLRDSHERILGAREDERGRLQRDLHDGLGPTLASLYQRVDAARGLIRDDPAAAESLLDDVASQTSAVIGEIRDLVRELRPPELDHLGLVTAIEAAAARLGPLDVTVAASDLGKPSPVVEIAAYRIVTEALTNVTRHASAQRASVVLERTATSLTIEICDDGAGFLTPLPATGTGLRSMRERAEELGGTLATRSIDGGGACVRAVLPWRDPNGSGGGAT